MSAVTRASAPGLPGRHTVVQALTARRSLAWRVFFVNAAVLAGVSAFYVLSPATISRPVAAAELLVLVAAITVTLFVNLLLLDRAFAPLDELRTTMQRVDPLDPGHRIELERADGDVAELAEAFNAMLDRLESERRESARRALKAQEEERVRIARELHDQLGQVLTGAMLLMRQGDGAVDEAREAVRHAIDDVRRIVRDLRPEALDDLGLASALRVLGRGFEHQSGIALHRSVPADLPPLLPEQELVIYRVAQEALTNVARHAGAAGAELVVETSDDHVRVTVTDDGDGFGGPAPLHGGIRGMRERALLVGGTLAVASAPGRGTRVRLTVPLESP